MAKPIAAHIGLFDDVMASDGKINLRNAAKRDALTKRFGERGYDYAGNSTDDLGVWPAPAKPLWSMRPDHSPVARRRDHHRRPDFFTEPAPVKSLIRALRPHQWIKNLILFIPVLTAHRLGEKAVLLRRRPFVAFGLAASAVYLLNDLFDLDADRHHATKRNRPLPRATCTAAIRSGRHAGAIAWGVELIILSVTAIRARHRALLHHLYQLLMEVETNRAARRFISCRTLHLASRRGSCRHGHSVVALVAHVLHVHLSKSGADETLSRRGIQSVREQNGHELKGRGYTAQHHNSVVTLGIVSGIAAVIVLGLYVNSAQVVKLYAHPKCCCSRAHCYWRGLVGSGFLPIAPNAR